MDYNDGLPYLPLRPFTDSEWDNLPHAFMTSDIDWDLITYDKNVSHSPTCYDTVTNDPTPSTNPNFDSTSDYTHRTVA